MRFSRRRPVNVEWEQLSDVVGRAWAATCPAFARLGAGGHEELVDTVWLSLLPLTVVAANERDPLFPPGVDHGGELLRKGSTLRPEITRVVRNIPAGSALRLAETAFYAHWSGGNEVLIFEVLDGPDRGLRLNIHDFEREVAWRQGFADISRAISMIVPAEAPEATDRRLAEQRLRLVEESLVGLRRLALDAFWTNSDKRALPPFFATEPPDALTPASPETLGVRPTS